jgi:kojibiose phosphorylase
MTDAENLWVVKENSFDARCQNHTETVFALGNGYMGTRGTFEEGYPGENRATFVHGVFDDVPGSFTELANLPDWTELTLILAGERFDLSTGEVLAFERSLDMHNACLKRTVTWRSPLGHTSKLEFKRFTSLADNHISVVRVFVTAIDYSASVELQSGIDSAADNLGYKHWVSLSQTAIHNQIGLYAQTRATQIELGMAARLWVSAPGDVESSVWDVPGHPSLAMRSILRSGQSLEIEKVVATYTSREVVAPMAQARDRINQLPPEPVWDNLWQAHTDKWAQEWGRCDVLIEGDDEAQLAVRFNLYHLLIAAPRQDETVNIGAKTLSGYGYRGHVFWDTEIFMLPFFTYTRPEIARNLLSYRFHHLNGARKKAAENHCCGAQYPWESAGDGEEVTPTWLPHPTDRTKHIRIWTGEIEIHISADIAYAVWQYVQVTGDRRFLLERGAPIIFETARFWASRAEWQEGVERYEYNDVIGPDEYHDHVDNNAYTNVMAAWHLRLAVQLYQYLKKEYTKESKALFENLLLKAEEVEDWYRIAEKIYCPFNAQNGLIEQFEGYFEREDVDLSNLEGRCESIQALFGIEKTNQTQVLKQPDVLMLMYLLPEFYSQSVQQANYDYYTPRTDHTFGSSLGPSIQAIMACRMGRIEEAYEHFKRSARADLHDVRGNAGDGIHGASAGGLWQAVVFGFAGLHLKPDGTWAVKPCLPPGWKRLAFKFVWQGQVIPIEVRGNEAEHD